MSGERVVRIVPLETPLLWTRGVAARETLSYLDRRGIDAEPALLGAGLSPRQVSRDEIGLSVAPAGKLIAVRPSEPEREAKRLIPQFEGAALQPVWWHWLAARHRFAVGEPSMTWVTLNKFQDRRFWPGTSDRHFEILRNSIRGCLYTPPAWLRG